MKKTVQVFRHETLGEVKFVDLGEGVPSKKASARDIEICTGQGIGKMDIPSLRVLIAQDINKGRINAAKDEAAAKMAKRRDSDRGQR